MIESNYRSRLIQQMRLFIVPLVLLAACKTSALIKQTPAEKPSTVTLIDLDITVKTYTADARASRIEIHDSYAGEERARLLMETMMGPKTVVVLFTDSKGNMKIRCNGVIRWGNSNFAIRSRGLFPQKRFATVVYDPA